MSFKAKIRRPKDGVFATWLTANERVATVSAVLTVGSYGPPPGKNPGLGKRQSWLPARSRHNAGSMREMLLFVTLSGPLTRRSNDLSARGSPPPLQGSELPRHAPPALQRAAGFRIVFGH